jgi:hypothetical protein
MRSSSKVHAVGYRCSKSTGVLSGISILGSQAESSISAPFEPASCIFFAASRIESELKRLILFLTHLGIAFPEPLHAVETRMNKGVRRCQAVIE